MPFDTRRTPVLPVSLLAMRQQRGVILVFAMIVMVILFIGAAAVVKSMNTSLTTAGNLAFRRDMVNQGELALAQLIARMQSGGTLASLGNSSNTTLNYSAVIMPSNAEGIPTALLDDNNFTTAGSASNDINDNTTGLDDAIKSGLRGTTIRYLIERMCREPEAPSSSHCVESSITPPGGTANTVKPPPITATVYRVNIRVTGPRDTQVFIQASINKPE